MKIYIATSWKMEALAKLLARELRVREFEVDCFCDSSSGRYVFHWNELTGGEDQKYDAISFIADERVKRAFEEDKKWLDWADTVILIVPSGRSAHLEAGYAKGQGKKLFIWGNFPKGEFDVVYRFADRIFRIEETYNLIEELKTMRRITNANNL